MLPSATPRDVLNHHHPAGCLLKDWGVRTSTHHRFGRHSKTIGSTFCQIPRQPELLGAANVGVRNVHLPLLMGCFRSICDLAIHVQYFFMYIYKFDQVYKLINSSSTIHDHPLLSSQWLWIDNPWNNRALTPPWCRFQRPQLHLGMHHQGHHQLGLDRNPPRPYGDIFCFKMLCNYKCYENGWSLSWGPHVFLVMLVKYKKVAWYLCCLRLEICYDWVPSRLFLR